MGLKTEEIQRKNPPKKVSHVKKEPHAIDISSEPYDKYLLNLKYWKIKDTETIITTLDSLLKYQYSCLSQLQMIAQEVSSFHKQICKVNEKNISDTQKVEVETAYFEKIIQLKNKFKKLEKQGCFSGEKKIKSKLQEFHYQKKNLINVKIMVPESLLASEKQQFHRNHLSKLYRAFVSYYPESHSDISINEKLVSFLIQLYNAMKKRYFYLKQKQYFELQIDKLCSKLKKSKYLQNKRKMLSGEIKIKDVVLNRVSAFQNLIAKKKDEQEMMKILKESEIRLIQGDFEGSSTQPQQFQTQQRQSDCINYSTKEKADDQKEEGQIQQ